MSARLRILAGIEASSSSTLDIRDAGRPVFDVISDVPNEVNARSYRLAGGAPLAVADMCGVAAGTVLLVRTWATTSTDIPGAVTVALTNALGVASLTVTPLTGSIGGFLLLVGPFTALSIANPGAVGMTVQIMVAGD